MIMPSLSETLQVMFANQKESNAQVPALTTKLTQHASLQLRRTTDPVWAAEPAERDACQQNGLYSVQYSALTPQSPRSDACVVLLHHPTLPAVTLQ